MISHWVPHQFSDEQKRDQVRSCRESLEEFRDGFWRLCDIITGDKIWTYHRQIDRKPTSAS